MAWASRTHEFPPKAGCERRDRSIEVNLVKCVRKKDRGEQEWGFVETRKRDLETQEKQRPLWIFILYAEDDIGHIRKFF